MSYTACSLPARLHSNLIFFSTKYPAIANAPLPAEGSAAFSNLQFVAVLLVGPWLVTKILPFKTGWTFYFFLCVLLFLPLGMGYWHLASKYGKRINEKVPFPGKPLEHYIDLKNSTLQKYAGKKIPMQIFHDAYFDGKVDFKGDVLDVMEYRHDWASFEFTKEVSCLRYSRPVGISCSYYPALPLRFLQLYPRGHHPL